MLLTVPVKPYTLKFLDRHLGNNYKLRKDDAFGNHLFNLLQKNNKRTEYNTMLGRYTCTFTVAACRNRLYKNAARELTSLTIINFNNFAELVFKHEFHSYVDFSMEERGLTMAEAIRQFCIKFKLTEDDISQETLRRSYIRYQAKKK